MRLFPIALFLLCGLQAGAAVHAVIVRGSGGEPEYETRFAEWTGRLSAALGQRLYIAPENIAVAGGESGARLEEIASVFAGLAERSTAEDTVAVFLIGHGSYQRTDAKLNLDGPDLTAAQLDEWLDAAASETAVVINSASTSAAFINALSGSGRIVCSATKGVEERNATEYMEHLIQSLEDGSADTDRDGRVSVYELCRQAAAMTEAWYIAEGYIAAEHALLDDNGDQLGTRLILAEGAEPARPRSGEAPGQLDGELAKTVYLTATLFQGAPPDLVAAYEAAIGAVEAYIARKAEVEEAAYYAELERLLVAAAEAHRTVRAAVPEAGEAATP